MEDARFAAEAVVWDVDGTLIDSEPLHERVFYATCRRHGVDLSDLDAGVFVGVHQYDVWEAVAHRFPPHVDRDAWLADLDAEYLADQGSLAAMPDALAVVQALDAAGIRQACASNSGAAVVAANLATLGILPYLAATVTLDDVANGKPAPDPYARACMLLGVSPERAVAVEDSITGLMAARAAGLRTIGFAANPHIAGKPEFRALADRLIQRLDELPALVATAPAA
ncbi:HAD family hydrolase [Geminicoccus roseus]|uniref:HAD family hydrolase n=1 Tax=Geminicoccus roseus TaxID=404900 RepID=UPI00040788C4|nr:HAD family phosphatase [Geminicoccus roseus]